MSAISITFQWTAPLYKANTVTEYQIQYRVQSESLIMNATIADVGQTVFTVTDLTPGTSYQFRVIPVNSLGDGPQTIISALTGTVSPKSLFCIMHLSCTHSHACTSTQSYYYNVASSQGLDLAFQ